MSTKHQAVIDSRLEVLEKEIAAPPKPVEPDPIEQILGAVDRIMGQAHDVAVKQCRKAREAIESASREALRTIDMIEETINAKRTGTSDQMRAYMEAVHTATVSADEVNATTTAAIGEVRAAIGRVSDQVRVLPAPAGSNGHNLPIVQPVLTSGP